MDTKSSRLKAALDALYYSGAYRAMVPLAGGRGAIFMLHRVHPGANGTKTDAFDPNGFLAVSPEFLDRAISRVKATGFELVDLDEAAKRLKSGTGGRFACFTLDDGYRDNRDSALPVFERHDCPLTVYVSAGFASRKASPWWIVLERILKRENSLNFEFAGSTQKIDCRTDEAKYGAYGLVADLFAKAPGDDQAGAMARLADRYRFDRAALSAELTMSWSELAEFSTHPLVTLGAHTISHPVLANLDVRAAAEEMEVGAAQMAIHLGKRPRHFAYPYGHDWAAGPREFAMAAQLGFETGVTTRKGVLFAEHGDHITALPRISLNGDYQQDRYVDVLVSGAPFALLNRFRKVNAA